MHKNGNYNIEERMGSVVNENIKRCYTFSKLERDKYFGTKIIWVCLNFSFLYFQHIACSL